MKQVIEEDVLIDAVNSYKLQTMMDKSLPKESNFSKALEYGKQFKDEGLTPYYVFDSVSKMVYVTSIEHVEKKLN